VTGGTRTWPRTIGALFACELVMQWTRPTWPVAFDMTAYGIVLVAMLVATGLWPAFGG